MSRQLIFDPKTKLELPNVNGVEEVWDSAGNPWRCVKHLSTGTTLWENSDHDQYTLGELIDRSGFLSLTKPATKTIRVGDTLKTEEDFDQCLTGTVIIGKQQLVWQRSLVGTWNTPASHFAGTHTTSQFFAPDLAKWEYPGPGPWTVIYTPTQNR